MAGRIRWVLTERHFANRRARLRAFWYCIVKGYRHEICMECGCPVGPHTGSWWQAPGDLWEKVNGGPNGVMCPPCFTAAAVALGEPIHWEAVRGV